MLLECLCVSLCLFVCSSSVILHVYVKFCGETGQALLLFQSTLRMQTHDLKTRVWNKGCFFFLLLQIWLHSQDTKYSTCLKNHQRLNSGSLWECWDCLGTRFGTGSTGSILVQGEAEFSLRCVKNLEVLRLTSHCRLLCLYKHVPHIWFI